MNNEAGSQWENTPPDTVDVPLLVPFRAFCLIEAADTNKSRQLGDCKLCVTFELHLVDKCCQFSMNLPGMASVWSF